MNIDIGNFSLISAFLLALYASLCGSYGAYHENQKFISSARNAVFLFGCLALAALVSLCVSFLIHDYRFAYVWKTSNNAMHPLYLISAVWGGMDGSMLLWATMLCIYSSIVVFNPPEVPRKLYNWVIPVLSTACCFFLTITACLTNPFRSLPSSHIPLDGIGLNPLLQNPSMLIHPPMLYLGLTGFTIPFAFSVAALLSGELDRRWTRVTRTWTILAWGFLTVGIILGGHWAYVELGWGGFWAWDPVENASFMPWLTGTAYLHSVMPEERRGILRVWNISLSIITYMLAVFGTFLTRSGVVQSVHAFAETDFGWVFLLYIGLMLALSIVLIVKRYSKLQPENRLESYLSREAAFLFNNLALLGICFATFWGVMYPVFSEAITGTKAVVGPPFFNAVNVPFFLLLLFLMGVGPLIAWKKSSLGALQRMFLGPLIFGSIISLIGYYLDSTRPLAATAFGLSGFVIASLMSEIYRAVRVHRQMGKRSHIESLSHIVRKKPRVYGGHLVHLGVVIMAVAITAATAYKIEEDISLPIGKLAKIGPYTIVIRNISQSENDNYSVVHADIGVIANKGNLQLGLLRPERRFYKRSQQPTSEVDIRSSLRDDLYIALGGLETNKEGVELIALRVFVNPLQIWVWFGGMVIVMGTLVVMSPELSFALQRLKERIHFSKRRLASEVIRKP